MTQKWFGNHETHGSATRSAWPGARGAACVAALSLALVCGGPLRAQEAPTGPGGAKKGQQECPDFLDVIDAQFEREIENDPEVKKLGGQLDNASADVDALRARLSPAQRAAEADRAAADQAKAAADQAKAAATTAQQTAAASQAAARDAAAKGAPYPPGVFTKARQDTAAMRAADAASAKADGAAQRAEAKAAASKQRADSIEPAYKRAQEKADALKKQYDAAREKARKRIEDRYGPADCPPKTGTGSAQPNKPPEPPKAPSDSPDSGHSSFPSMKFRGEVFANVAFMPQFGAGTAINGGRHSIIDSPGTITGAGFNFGLDIPTTLNAFGSGREPWWSIDIGYARATGSSNGQLAPGAATTGFDYIAPNPASGFVFIDHLLNGQIVYVDSERDQFDAEILHNVKWQAEFAGEYIKKPVEISAGVGFQFRAIWDSHRVTQTIINFPEVTSSLKLDSSTFFLAPKVMLRGEYEVGKFEFYVGAYFAPGLAIASGRAEQQARCPVCAASEQTVNLSRDDSFVKFAVNTGARAWVSYEVTPAVKARAFVGYDYFSNTARWQLDPGNAHLKGASTGNFRVGVGLNLRF